MVSSALTGFREEDEEGRATEIPVFVLTLSFLGNEARSPPSRFLFPAEFWLLKKKFLQVNHFFHFIIFKDLLFVNVFK